jgi:hypothetical protein
MTPSAETHQGQKCDFPGKIAILAPPAGNLTIPGAADLRPKIDE